MTDLLKTKKYKALFAILCAVGWSLAYPLIKVGYGVFGIAADDLGGKLLFAGVRFFSAGLLIVVFCAIKHRSLGIKKKADLSWLILLALVNTTLHYMFAYIGLSNNQSGRSTILDSLGGFILIVLSTVFFADDKMNIRKVIGCVLGLGGIVLISIGPTGLSFDNITFAGDGMILLNAICAAFGGIITRIVSKKMDILSATGWSMTIGGAILLLISVFVGIKGSWMIRPIGVIVLIALIMISAVCFAIYNALLTYHPISEIAIYNALIPVLGVVISALLLQEPLKWQYILSVLLVAAGIWIINIKRSEVGRGHDSK